jgi:hypothetical protein
MVIIKSQGAIDKTAINSWFQNKTAIKQHLLKKVESLVSSLGRGHRFLSAILEGTEMFKKAEETTLPLLQVILKKGAVEQEQLTLLKDFLNQENDSLSRMINDVTERAKTREGFVSGMEVIVIDANSLIAMNAKLLSLK